MAKEIFYAEEGSLTVASTDYTTEVKEISITGGERNLEVVRTHGGGEYQDPKPITSPMEISATCVGRDSDFRAMVFGGALASGSLGSAVAAEPATAYTVIYNLYDVGTADGAQWMFKFASAIAVSCESRLNATDHLEETITFKCAPKYYYEKWTGLRTSSPIT